MQCQKKEGGGGGLDRTSVGAVRTPLKGGRGGLDLHPALRLCESKGTSVES